MWALIIDGAVREVTEIDPAGRFHPSIEWRECGPDVCAGFTWSAEGGFKAPGVLDRAGTEAAVWDRIKVERDKRTLAGYQVGEHWVHSDIFSRNQWLGLKDNARDVLAAGGDGLSVLVDRDGEPIQWKMLGGEFVFVTAQLACDVVAVVTSADKDVFTAAEVHKVMMRASADPAQYDYSGGWPQTYAEWVAAQVPESVPEPEPAPEPEPEPGPDPEPVPEEPTVPAEGTT